MEKITSEIKAVINQFPFSGEVVSIKKTGSGLINSTYKIESSDGNQTFKYILQQINTEVFKNPDELMSNIMNVTAFLRAKIALDGGNPNRETLTFLYTKDNASYYRDDNNRCWRAYIYIDNCTTHNSISSSVLAERSGKAFGRFQNLLADYPIDNLFETIVDFHNTPVRYEAFKKAVSDNISGRAENAKAEIEFALSREKDASKLTDMLKAGELPLRVTHNDTKINNVLFDIMTNEAFCVIDLDTIMPGLFLYDFGDAIRAGGTTADENEQDLSKYNLNLDYYKGFAQGFLSCCAETLTQNEVDNMAFSAKLMALECGVRFLTDYLNGDTYFKTEYDEHNLCRTRTQFKLVTEVENNLDVMNEMTEEIYRRSLLED